MYQARYTCKMRIRFKYWKCGTVALALVLGGCVSMLPPASEIPEQKSQWLEITELCAAGSPSPEQKFCPPPIARETRAAWVATVANIDWPSRSDLTQPEQVAEITRIVDRAAALKLNMLVLQVRPAGDAMYRSTLEPWSEFLTGAQGRAPSGDPTYDPLQEWVTQAHRRGIALHAWFNPGPATRLQNRPSMRATLPCANQVRCRLTAICCGWTLRTPMQVTIAWQ
jgi:uncharacterized lipoprotein YddW (UPF0748 family)